MASITKRNGRFFVRVRRQGYATATKTFTLRADAQAWARRVEADMEAGRWAEAGRRAQTLKEAIIEYERTVLPRLKSAAEARPRLAELKETPWAGKPLMDLSAFDISAWRDDQLRTRQPATVLRKLMLLSGVLTWCVKERGWLPRNPVSNVRMPRQPDGRSRVLAEQERDHLIAAARTSKATWLAPALTLLMSSAMRRGELFGLRLTDLDLSKATVHLSETKNGSVRDVPLCPAAVEALKALEAQARRRGDDRLLPCNSVGSLSTRFIVTVRRARRAYEADCAARQDEPEAGFLRDVRLHDLRHHAVTAWASTGALSLMELMAISGHKSPRMLARYTHLSAQALAAKLGRVYAAHSETNAKGVSAPINP